MFIVLLRFSSEKAKARELMPAHNAWLQSGFDDGVFLVAGSLQSGSGGAILAHDTTRAELDERLERDPFVAQHVVTVEVLEVSPSKMDPRFAFVV